MIIIIEFQMKYKIIKYYSLRMYSNKNGTCKRYLRKLIKIKKNKRLVKQIIFRQWNFYQINIK